MSNKSLTTTTTPDTTAAAPAAANSAGNDATALLLEVLRNVNRQVQTASALTALDGRALTAVQHFQAISLDLRTLADGPTSGFGSSSSARQR